MVLFPFLSSIVSRILYGQKSEASFGLIKRIKLDKDLAARDWNMLENKFEVLSSEDLTRVLDGLFMDAAYIQPIWEYVNAVKSETQRLVLGAYNLLIAWQRRGGGWGADLSEFQINQFRMYLEKAEQDLLPPFENLTYEAEAKARLIRVEMGLSDGDAATSAFEHVMSLDGKHLLAHLHYFKTASPKWLGDANVLRQIIANTGDDKLRLLLEIMYVVELYSDKKFRMHENVAADYQKAKEELLPHILSNARPIEDDSLLGIYMNNYLACLYRILNMPVKYMGMYSYTKAKRTTYPWAYFGWE